MKRSLYLLICAACLCLAVCCERDSGGPGTPANSVTVRLAGLAGEEFAAEITPGTRTDIPSGTYTPVDFNKYAVKFFLFESPLDGDTTDPDTWRLIRIDDVTSPLYRIGNLQTEGYSYKYLFAATRRAAAARLVPRDFASGIGGDPAIVTAPTITQNTAAVAQTPATPGTLLPNCYFQIADRDDIRYADDLTLPVQEDPEIFAGGFYLLVSTTVHTPPYVVMQRQVGMVEFQLDLEAGTHQVACSIPSDYYRLYLSQAIRGSVDDPFTSLNDAQDGTWLQTTGDYGSLSHFMLSENMTEEMYVFTKQQSVTLTEAERYKFQVYLPYTADSGQTPTNVLQANYNQSQGRASTLTLTVDGQKYVYNQPFPVLRNTKTFFFIKGSQLVATFGSPDGGIGLDDDNWDGIQ